MSKQTREGRKAVGSIGPGSAGSNPRSASMLGLYETLDQAMAAQRSFEARSLVGEMWSQLGQYGLHFAETEADVLGLLRAGAPVDGVRRIEDYDDDLQHWETPLLTACVDERFAVADALIRLGANVDAPNAVRYPSGQGFGHTALHMVVVRRDRASAERLITAGANVNSQTTMGITPLWYAANNDDPELVDLLLRSGARTDIPEFGGSLPQDKCGPRTRALLEKAPTSTASGSYGDARDASCDVEIDSAGSQSEVVPPNGKTALMHWAASGDLSRVKALLDQGADVDAVDEDGDGVLRYAMGRRHAVIFDLLLQRGADPNSMSTSASGRAGFSILHAVVEMGWYDGAQALLHHGADVNARGRDGITPMMLAAGAGHDSCVTLLHKAGAKVDALDADGDSALFYAASQGRRTSVEVLLALGARADAAPGTSGQSPLSIAAHMASPQGRGRPADVPASDYTRIVLDLMRAGADATLMYKRGYAIARQSVNGLHIATFAELRRLDGDDNDWSVIWATESGRRDRPDLFRADPVPAAAGAAQSGDRPSPRSARIQIIGSQQTGFISHPAVRVIWKGREVGRVPHGGRFDLEIDSDGDVLLKYAFRSARVPVKLSEAAPVYLGWDRTWGRLVATRDRAALPS